MCIRDSMFDGAKEATSILEKVATQGDGCFWVSRKQANEEEKDEQVACRHEMAAIMHIGGVFVGPGKRKCRKPMCLLRHF